MAILEMCLVMTNTLEIQSLKPREKIFKTLSDVQYPISHKLHTCLIVDGSTIADSNYYILILKYVIIYLKYLKMHIKQ